MTVSAFSSVSLKPPMVLICVDKTATIYPTLLVQDSIGISVLSEEQEKASRRFATKDVERFDDLAITRGKSGVALLDGSLAHLECRIIERHEGGDHTIFVAHVDGAAVLNGRPLLYYRGGYAQLER